MRSRSVQARVYGGQPAKKTKFSHVLCRPGQRESLHHTSLTQTLAPWRRAACTPWAWPGFGPCNQTGPSKAQKKVYGIWSRKKEGKRKAYEQAVESRFNGPDHAWREKMGAGIRWLMRVPCGPQSDARAAAACSRIRPGGARPW